VRSIAHLREGLKLPPYDTQPLMTRLAELEEKITAEFQRSLRARLKELEGRVAAEFQEKFARMSAKNDRPR
jgi:hypothetical protein